MLMCGSGHYELQLVYTGAYGHRLPRVATPAAWMIGRSFVPGPHTLYQNHLLAALPTSECGRLDSSLELVPLPLGEVLYESGDQLHHVYFPIDSIVSLLYVMADGASAEIAMVGKEGIIGIALFMGGETMPNRAVVQSAGYAYRLKGQLLKEEFNRAGDLQQFLVR